MSVCKKCGRKGLLLRVDRTGLCDACARARRAGLYHLCFEDKAGDPPRKLTDEAIRRAAIQRAENLLRIVMESARLLETTAKPETFYSRLGQLTQRLDDLARFEAVDPTLFAAGLPSALRPEIDAAASEAETRMWSRAYEAMMDRAGGLKTDKARANAVARFFDNARGYEAQMGGAARQRLDALERRHAVGP